MLGLMIFGELVQYLDRGKPGQVKSYTSQIQRLKTAYDLSTMSFSKDILDSNLTNLNSTLENVAKEVEPESTKNLTAAGIYAAVLTEQKKPVPEAVIKELGTAKRDVELREIYGSASLTKERAAAIEKKMAAKGFLGRLATKHAWEKAGEKGKIKLADPNKGPLTIGVVFAATIATLLGGALLVGFVIARVAGYLPANGIPLERLSKVDADRLAIRAAQFVGLFLVVQIIGAIVSPILPIDRSLMTMLVTIGMIVCFIQISKKPVLGRTFTLEMLGIRRENLGTHILWGVGGAIANLPIVIGTALLSQKIFQNLPNAEHPVNTQIQNGIQPMMLVSILFAAVIAAPILEEIMFRGAILPAMARGLMPIVAAILFQGLLFATIHPTGIPAWLPLAAVGAMSGFLSRQTGSLVPSIVMHGVHNLGTLILALTIAS